ncbi:IS701 family transposase [Streptomyces phaeochromogenes]|uniref:IS701 family transposase n=1 Tax=Streptomyces phaeochromogenes TaxID=1923 RepID=UPI003F4CC8AA
MSRIAGRFTRVESRCRARKLVLGLLSDLPRKNYWTIAERAGDRTPDGMQHPLGPAKWDADEVRDDVRAYVIEHLHDDEAVLVVDETGDVKKGTGTVGVQRQYTGTAGRVENSQVAVYLAYSTPRGHAAIDRELYVPRSWTSDPDRCRAAGLGDKTEFATKPELAARMVTRFLDAGHRAAWVAGDEVYGGNPRLRAALEERGTGYVLAVACSHEVTTGAGKFRADMLARKVPKRAWQKLSAEVGAKGHRFYDWAVIDLTARRPGSRRADPQQPQHRRTRVLPLLLAGRSAADHPDLREQQVRRRASSAESPTWECEDDRCSARANRRGSSSSEVCTPRASRSARRSSWASGSGGSWRSMAPTARAAGAVCRMRRSLLVNSRSWPSGLPWAARAIAERMTSAGGGASQSENMSLSAVLPSILFRAPTACRRRVLSLSSSARKINESLI